MTIFSEQWVEDCNKPFQAASIDYLQYLEKNPPVQAVSIKLNRTSTQDAKTLVILVFHVVIIRKNVCTYCRHSACSIVPSECLYAPYMHLVTGASLVPLARPHALHARRISDMLQTLLIGWCFQFYTYFLDAAQQQYGKRT